MEICLKARLRGDKDSLYQDIEVVLTKDANGYLSWKNKANKKFIHENYFIPTTSLEEAQRQLLIWSKEPDVWVRFEYEV
jgi:hypothetical protein